ncbi:MAG: TCP-1/cpn60 chaperonin family protein, partial [Thermoplasmata archaeon]|nr:TCP-1/cpn60 chaperonin family protein [Thermoplasmata archaeon]
VLQAVARTSLGTWPDDAIGEVMADAVVRAALQVAEPGEDGWRCDRWRVHILPMGGSGFSLETVNGYVLKQVRDYDGLPRRVTDARIALFDAAPTRGRAGIGTPRLRWSGTKFKLKSPSEYQDFTDWGTEYTRGIIEGLQRAGANVVLCRLGISDHALKLLADAGILGIRRLMRSRRMENLAEATGASLVKDFKSVQESDLGRAGVVEERRFGGERFTILSDCPGAKVVTLIVRAPGEGMGEQYEELLRKAVGAVAAVIEDPRVVAGGSALEATAAQHVRREAARIRGRAQLGAEAFSRALEDLVVIMAANMGLDPMDALLDLRRLNAEHPTYGLRAGERGPVDLAAGAVSDALAVRVAAWGRAVDACGTVLRVDAFHKSKGTLKEEKVEERKEEGPTPVKPSLEEN